MITLEINSVEYDFPEVMDEDWGDEVTQWAVAVTEGMLQKAGGLFTLEDEVDFGNFYGLMATYYKTRTEKNVRDEYIATDGEFRLANIDSIQWRNDANDANLSLELVNDELVFNGVALSAPDNYPSQLGYGGF